MDNALTHYQSCQLEYSKRFQHQTFGNSDTKNLKPQTRIPKTRKHYQFQKIWFRTGSFETVRTSLLYFQTIHMAWYYFALSSKHINRWCRNNPISTLCSMTINYRQCSHLRLNYFDVKYLSMIERVCEICIVSGALTPFD